MLGRRIAKERKKAGLTQEALADQLNVSRSTLACWECGKSEPSIKALKQLAMELRIPVGYLIGENDFSEIRKPLTLREEVTYKLCELHSNDLIFINEYIGFANEKRSHSAKVSVSESARGQSERLMQG